MPSLLAYVDVETDPGGAAQSLLADCLASLAIHPRIEIRATTE